MSRTATPPRTRSPRAAPHARPETIIFDDARVGTASFRPAEVSVLGWVVSGLVLVQSLFFLSQETLVPEKAAFLLPLGALGLPYLVAMALGHAGAEQNSNLKWGARLALAFLAWAALSAALAASPESAFFGLYQQMTGWFFLLCLAGGWAIATRLSSADRNVLELAIIAVAVGNAVISLIEQHVDLASIGLPPYPVTLQPVGTLGNPVFVGALLAGALALVIPRFLRSPVAWTWVVVFIGLGLGVSAERLPALLAVVFVVGAVAFAAYGAHRSGERRPITLGRALLPTLLFSAIVVGSIAIGSVTAGTKTATVPGGGTQSAPGGVINHIQSSTSQETFGERFQIWDVAWHAFTSRPVVGYGPNQFRAATQALYTPSLIKESVLGVNSSVEYFDAHDFVVELAVTTGFVGLALFIGWLVFCCRRRAGPLLIFALILLATELAEPLNPVITLLLFVALGAAVAKGKEQAPAVDDGGSGRQARLIPGPRYLRFGSWTLAAIGAIAAVLLVLGDVALSEGILAAPVSSNVARARASTAETFLSPWPPSAELWASIYQEPQVNEIARAAHWERLAVERDDSNSIALLELAAMEVSLGHMRAGKQIATQAMTTLPWNAAALDLLGAIDQAQGQVAEARLLYFQSLTLVPDQPLIESLLAGKCDPALPKEGTDHPLAVGCAPVQ